LKDCKKGEVKLNSRNKEALILSGHIESNIKIQGITIITPSAQAVKEMKYRRRKAIVKGRIREENLEGGGRDMLT